MLLAGCSLFARKMLYFPTHLSLEQATMIASRQGFEPWRNDAGEVIGWKRESKTDVGRPRLLITHGNGGCAVFRVNYLDNLQPVLPCDVYILEYPGYGARAGSPTETSFFNAADEAFGLLEKRHGGPIYIVGESLGTGVAAYLAGAHAQAISGVLLIAPYHNLTDVAQYHLRVLPARWLLPDKFESAAHLRAFHGPVAIVVGGRDTVVPAQFGRQLFDAYAGPKKLWEVPAAEHNDLPIEPVEWWREVVAFWNDKR
jgi:pimeloyl-ACP methyl ester carboxylesterase